jgi:hypothetical protein
VEAGGCKREIGQASTTDPPPPPPSCAPSREGAQQQPSPLHIGRGHTTAFYEVVRDSMSPRMELGVEVAHVGLCAAAARFQSTPAMASWHRFFLP